MFMVSTQVTANFFLSNIYGNLIFTQVIHKKTQQSFVGVLEQFFNFILLNSKPAIFNDVSSVSLTKCFLQKLLGKIN